jgi:serine phosphatase RsbU (regulator of sigma subunit)
MGRSYDIDSLKTLLKADKEDTTKVFHQYSLAREILKSNPDSSILLCKSALDLANKLTWDRGIAFSYIVMGRACAIQSNSPLALTNYNNAIAVGEKLGNNEIISVALTNIGSVYYDEKDYDKALDYYLRSLKIDREINNKWGIARNVGVIGLLYADTKKYEKALEYYYEALKMTKEIGNKNGIAVWLGNIGNLYKDQGDLKQALTYNLDALKLFNELGNKWSAAETQTEIGEIYTLTGKYEQSFDCLYHSLAVFDSLGVLAGVQSCYEELSHLYEKSDVNLKDSIGGKILSIEEMRLKALYYHKKFDAIRDSIFGKQHQKQLMKIEFEKKEMVAKAEQEKKDFLTQQKVQKQKIIIGSAFLGLLLTLLFAWFILRSLKLSNQQRKVIEQKNKEITDSIEYALRIQTAILPTDRMVKQQLKNSFILYKPKDIVAGDFYWMEAIDNVVLFAACDCTGHGVPGALVSVVRHNALNRAVREFGLSQPAAILNKTAELVIENFENSEEQIKDGMDVSICAYSSKTLELQWAGANNPLWIVRNGELIEMKADKQPIGMNEDHHPFTNHKVDLQTGDNLYIFTGGFADQFGGISGEKKLTRKKFKELLLSIHSNSMEEQHSILDKFIIEYRNKVDQIDDILVMGIRI